MGDEPEGIYDISVQEEVPPAPAGSPNGVDWLPYFAGFSWLAYGTSSSVVISTAPSPSNTGEAIMGGFFQQILKIQGLKENEDYRATVTSVVWAPIGPFGGLLGAVAGKNVHIFAPKGRNQTAEVPLTWRKCEVLAHSSDVQSFSWTESGDGLLSTGSEVVMWYQSQGSWECLWRSHLEQPHSLSSASWSAKGVAATAVGDAVGVQEENVNHVAKVWWWEDGQHLQEFDLSHPQRLLMISWRPVKGFGSTSQHFRPVLLTSCLDGVVRLWAEIDSAGIAVSNSTNLQDPVICGLSTTAQPHVRFAFFVSAVIDVNSSLKGSLGYDIFVTWPEARGGCIRSSHLSEQSNNSLVLTDIDEAACDWLVGIGPHGAVTMWSMQSLDDLSPSRGPFVQLWQQGLNLLPYPSFSPRDNDCYAENQRCLRFTKAAVHRHYGSSSGPPSSLDIFEMWSPGLLRWSSLWPPVSAIVGPGSRTGLLSSGSGVFNTNIGKPSAWGVCSEILLLGGHIGDIIQTAIHPIYATHLAASLDHNGVVLLWDLQSASSNPRFEATGLLTRAWKLSGQLVSHRVTCMGYMSSMAWAPVLVSRNRAVLLLCHTQGVDFFLITKEASLFKGKPKDFFISYNLVYNLEWPMKEGYGLQGIYIVPAVSLSIEPPKCSCIVLGIGGDGVLLVSWKVYIEDCSHSKNNHIVEGQLEASMECHEIGTPSSQSEEIGESRITVTGGLVIVKALLIGNSSLEFLERVTCVAVSASNYLFPVDLDGASASVTEVGNVYDVVTGCADGVLRFWNVWKRDCQNASKSDNASVCFECVGVLKVYSGPVKGISLGSAGTKISCMSDSVNGQQIVQVWEAEGHEEDCCFYLEAQVVLASPVVALSWLDTGSGLSLLGVATEGSVQIYAQSRVPLLDFSNNVKYKKLSSSNWLCMAASSAFTFEARAILWDNYGSLVVVCRDHICFLSNWVSAAHHMNACIPIVGTPSATSSDHVGLMGSSSSLSHTLPLQKINKTLIGTQGTREESLSSTDIMVGTLLEATEEMGCPLPDYHPTSILFWLSRGNISYARACIRNLAMELSSLAAHSKPGTLISKRTKNSALGLKNSKLKVCSAGLVDLVPKDNHYQSLLHGLDMKEASCSGQLQMTRSYDPVHSDKYAALFAQESFGNSLRSELSEPPTKDDILANDRRCLVKSGGSDVFSKVEVEAISKVFQQSVEIDELLHSEEQSGLLALVDVVAYMDGVNGHSPADSLDLPGLRFWLAFQYASGCIRWTKGGNLDVGNIVVESKAISWALQSESKETLLDLCLPELPTWRAMRSLGTGFWLIDTAQLKKRMEKLAKAQYLERKDPKDCALLYLALDRCSVLTGLFKLSKDEKDKPLKSFLLRDFKDEKNKVAALKNAYILMGKHRYELAAAFFLLGQDIKTAVNICAKNLGDVQLALIICRLLERPGGPLECELIINIGLPVARQSGDCWLASLLQWLLGKGIEALEELTVVSKRASDGLVAEAKDFRKPSWLFPLDPDIGSYCALLIGKPRMRAIANAVDLVSLKKRANARSVLALRKLGLPLPALELLVKDSDAILYKYKCDLSKDLPGFLDAQSEASASKSISADFNRQEVGIGWVTHNIMLGMYETSKVSLALQCAFQSLKDHPDWIGEICFSVQSEKKIFEPTINRTSNDSGDSECNAKSMEEQGTGCSLLIEADKKFADNLQVLEKKFRVNTTCIIPELIRLVCMHRRFHLLQRMFFQTNMHMKALESDFKLFWNSVPSLIASQHLDVMTTEGPWALARGILACGGAPKQYKLPHTKMSENNSFEDKNGALSGVVVQEFVKYGHGIHLLSSGKYRDNYFPDKQKIPKTTVLFFFVCCVTAAWLGREGKTLLALVGPTVNDLSTLPEVPLLALDAATWSLRRAEGTKRGSIKGKMVEHSAGLESLASVTIGDDDVWRVLGVTLWTHLLGYVRKQLTGNLAEASYSSFGRISLPQMQAPSGSSSKFSLLSPSQPHPLNISSKAQSFLGKSFQSNPFSSAWFDFISKFKDSHLSNQSFGHNNGNDFAELSGDVKPGSKGVNSYSDMDDLGTTLLSSLTSTAAGLRKLLAAHLENSMQHRADPLAIWLWGRPVEAVSKHLSGAFGGTDSSHDSSFIVPPLEQHKKLSKAHILVTDIACEELWKLLVVREKVRTALGLEGLNGPHCRNSNEELGGWYPGKRGPVPRSGAIGSEIDQEVKVIDKVTPRRIAPVESKASYSMIGGAWHQEGDSSLQEQSHLSKEFTEAYIESTHRS